MKIFILFLGTIMLLISCSKEPNIMSNKEYELMNAKLYYVIEEEKIVPQISSASFIHDAIIINSTLIEKDGSKQQITFTVNNEILGKTKYHYFNFLNGIDKNWCVLSKNNSKSIYHCPEDSFIEITNFNKQKKTISGIFKIMNTEGVIKDLPFIDELDEHCLISYSKIEIIDTNISSFSNTYSSNIVTTVEKNSGLYFGSYYKYGFKLSTGFANKKSGTYLFSDRDNLNFGYNNNSFYYSNPETGSYTISDFLLNGHIYKKITFSTKLRKGSDYIELKNGEILFY